MTLQSDKNIYFSHKQMIMVKKYQVIKLKEGK